MPLTNGSGSGSRRPKNTRIRWIRIQEAQKHVDPVDPDPDPGGPKNTWIRWIRIRIRIRNTAANSLKNTASHISSSFMTAWCMSVLEIL
jgi:hypothetical protein